MKIPTSEEMRQILTDEVLKVTGLTAAVKDLVSAFEFQEQRNRVIPGHSRGKCKEFQILNRPVKLKTLVTYNSSAVNTYYVQLHDSINPAQEGTITGLIMAVAPGATQSFDFADGFRFPTGLYVCGSQQDVTKQLIAAADLVFAWNYCYDS